MKITINYRVILLLAEQHNNPQIISKIASKYRHETQSKTVAVNGRKFNFYLFNNTSVTDGFKIVSRIEYRSKQLV